MSDSHQLMLRMLAEGLPYQEVVRDRLIADGIPCTTDTKIYARVPEDHPDLWCGEYLLEVKSLGLRFTGPDDWPYAETFIDTVRTWDRKKRERLAIINISRPLGGMAVLPVASTRAHWYVTRKYDKQRQMEDSFYAVGREYLRPYSALVAHLRGLLEIGPAPARADRCSLPYCKAHRSHFCPCCKPDLYYTPRDDKHLQGWREIAPINRIGGGE